MMADLTSSIFALRWYMSHISTALLNTWDLWSTSWASSTLFKEM